MGCRTPPGLNGGRGGGSDGGAGGGGDGWVWVPPPQTQHSFRGSCWCHLRYDAGGVLIERQAAQSTWNLNSGYEMDVNATQCRRAAKVYRMLCSWEKLLENTTPLSVVDRQPPRESRNIRWPVRRECLQRQMRNLSHRHFTPLLQVCARASVRRYVHTRFE